MNADFIASKWPTKPMPYELVLLFGGLIWLAFVAFWPELDHAEQPNVALVWAAAPEARTLSDRFNESQKVFVLHNRSGEWVYNIQVHPLKLSEQLVFDSVNEIGPDAKVQAIARWGEKSSITTAVTRFFRDNEGAAKKKKWVVTKPHNRGISATYLTIPLRITYNSKDRAWQAKFYFHFDPGGESKIETLSKRRI